MLSNFQLGGQSLLQIFLLGQPEFRDLLRSPDLEQLRQRVIATHHLEPMLPSEVEPYVIHRLGIAGWAGDPAFTPAAFSALYAATGGVPRRLNALISRVLLLGAIEQIHEIDADAVAVQVEARERREPYVFAPPRQLGGRSVPHGRGARSQYLSPVIQESGWKANISSRKTLLLWNTIFKLLNY